MQEELSLREQKRLATLHRIEDCATALVDERGFRAVTVEDICRAAGISRRTFFNYFDSKDAAVLGTPAADFTDAQREAFLNTDAESILELIRALIIDHMATHHANDDIAARRQRISSDRDVALSALSRKQAKSQELTSLIEQRLERTPQLRRLPQVCAATEAMALSGLTREAVWIALSAPAMDSGASLPQRLDVAFELLTSTAKGLSW
ncbi:TetR family transcriptional regulator [Corynebacterium lizhenjunii]|uniref:TetR family transcriptional regulator n=1 Tax=Corynebacterium lizhenjunii TaxID=2709394 RepID=A0A7T0PCM7_9CORY|nr:TetR family transcriptional regulator [Corynebacterium lizhenjunii]QPK79887.1 TetR family transcriptional regulator [Corynebacterium lizhenjunii]